jgi:pimeloyl-ACP methyl ester carboxylesterase
MPPVPYRPLAAVRREDHVVRGLSCRVNRWGDPDAPAIFMLHGWSDTGMSFQFLADVMADRWQIIAPDWRGFGESAWCPAGYWFPDYLADLEVLLDRFAGGKPARIVGHSMGGNVAWLYAGTRPERVARVVSLDAFGLDETKPDEAPGRYARWLDQWRTPPAFSDYASLEDVAARVQKLAPRLDPGRAAFVAAEWSRRRPDGRFELRHDPGHKRVNPVLYRREEARACWRRIAAPCLLVLARESPFFRKYEEEGGREDCRSCIPALREAVVDAGHMLHLEQPGAVAELLDEFFRD